MNKITSPILNGLRAGWQKAKSHVENHKRKYAVGAILAASAIAAPFVGPVGICLPNFVVFLGAGVRSVLVDVGNISIPHYLAKRQTPIANTISCATAIATVSSLIVMGLHNQSAHKAAIHNQELACVAAKNALDEFGKIPATPMITGKYDNYDGKAFSSWRYPKDKEIVMAVSPKIGNAISSDAILQAPENYNIDHIKGSACVTLTHKGKSQTGVVAYLPDEKSYFVPVFVKKEPAPWLEEVEEKKNRKPLHLTPP